MSSLIRGGIRELRSKLRERSARKAFSASPASVDNIDVIVHFADPPVNLYQLRQWLEPLTALDRQHPVAIIARHPETAVQLSSETALPIILAEKYGDIEAWIGTRDPKLALYVNQNMRNFQMMRFASMLHVFCSHGESDKSYMASNQVKAYDFFFVAGQASVDRLKSTLLNYSVEERTRTIGRPQLAVHGSGPGMPRDERRVVLYAPTWEGDLPSMEYSSAVSHGPAMLASILADARYRVIYRPHPRLGEFDSSYASADALLRQRIEEANTRDSSARHLIDTGPDMTWQFQASDACITDVSAVAIDWLTTDKPLVVTEPSSISAVVATDGFLSDVSMITSHDAADIVKYLEEPVDVESRHRWVEYYFGDRDPRTSMNRWLAACDEVIALRNSEMAAKKESD